MSSWRWLQPLWCTQRISWNLVMIIRAAQQFSWWLLLCISWATRVVMLIFCNQILEFRLPNPWEIPVTSVQCSHKSCSFVWEYKYLPIQDRKRWLNWFRTWEPDLESKRRTTDLSTGPLDSHKPELYRTQSRWQNYFPVFTTKYQQKEGWNTEHKIRTHDFMVIIRTCSDELKQCALGYKKIKQFLQSKWPKVMISTPESVNNTVLKYSWLKEPVYIPLGRKRNKKVNGISDNLIFFFFWSFEASCFKRTK